MDLTTVPARVKSAINPDPAAVAGEVISVLTPFVTEHAEEFGKAAGRDTHDKVGNILATLKTRWNEDEEAADTLARFEQKPGRYKPVLNDILREKLAQDRDLTNELAGLLKELGPGLNVIQKMGASGVEYPKLSPRGFAVMTPAEYISERLNPSIAWYDKVAGENKNKYLRMRATTVIGGALVPVLVNIDLPYINLVTTIISLIVVLLVSLESVYHFREQWTNYRSTEQNLRNEYFLFTTKGGTYEEVEEKEAYKLFVNRVEEVIEAENSSTLKVMTTLTETKSRQQGKQGMDNSIIQRNEQ